MYKLQAHQAPELSWCSQRIPNQKAIEHAYVMLADAVERQTRFDFADRNLRGPHFGAISCVLA